MNSTLRCSLPPEPFRPCDAIQPDDIHGIRTLHPVETPTGFLGNPRKDSYQSGIGVISGWVCEADFVEVNITRMHQDGRYDPVGVWRAGYGTNRPDTKPVCGDQDNGFGLLINWNEFGEGKYTAIAYVNGRDEIGGARFTITTLGEPFLQGVTGEFTLPNFPTPGKSVVIQWEESLQNFVIKDTQP